MSVEEKEFPVLKIDDSLALSIINAVKTAFKTTFSVDVEAEKPYTSKECHSVGDYTAMVGMVQSHIEARLSVSFKREHLVSLLSNIYSPEELEDEENLQDSVGEIINVIYGLTKADLNKKGYSFVMTIPTVVVGEDHHLHHLHQGVNMYIPFVMGNTSSFIINILGNR